VLGKVIEKLDAPLLRFGIGGAIVLLIAAGIVGDSRAPLYVGAIVILFLAVLAAFAYLTGRPEREGSAFKAKVRTDDEVLADGGNVGGLYGQQLPGTFASDIKAKGKIVARGGGVVGGVSTAPPASEKKPD